MFQRGDKVLYGIHGVCDIVGLDVKTVDRKTIEYYVLTPVEQPGARFYVPTQNAAAVAKLRPLMTQEELIALLNSSEAGEDSWIPDENLRKQRYRELITSGDRIALVKMVNALHKHKKQQQASGKKFHLCDENFLRDAQKLLDSEFSLVLNLDRSEVTDYVKKALSVE